MSDASNLNAASQRRPTIIRNMLLTVSKRLELSASRRLHVKDWSEEENLAVFGPETNARYGSGRNYIAYFVFTGPVDPATGMLINISEIKERAEKVLRDGFDHKFLNQDNPSFREVPPTAENVARQLYCDVASLFSDVGAKLSVCHLSESPERSATYYFTGACEANYWFEFSAARRTMSPKRATSVSAIPVSTGPATKRAPSDVMQRTSVPWRPHTSRRWSPGLPRPSGRWPPRPGWRGRARRSCADRPGC